MNINKYIYIYLIDYNLSDKYLIKNLPSFSPLVFLLLLHYSRLPVLESNWCLHLDQHSRQRVYSKALVQEYRHRTWRRRWCPCLRQDWNTVALNSRPWNFLPVNWSEDVLRVTTTLTSWQKRWTIHHCRSVRGRPTPRSSLFSTILLKSRATRGLFFPRSPHTPLPSVLLFALSRARTENCVKERERGTNAKRHER